jgi:hypothetical protein
VGGYAGHLSLPLGSEKRLKIEERKEIYQILIVKIRRILLVKIVANCLN